MTLSDPLRVTTLLVRELENLKIPYLVGGSLASSLYGIPRATQDVDVVIEVDRATLQKLCAGLEASFYVDAQMALDALKSGGVFNIIDREDLFKIDVFISAGDELLQMEMARRVSFQLSDRAEDKIVVCSAEDIVAHKLYWYKLGECVSERQWNDAINVLKVQKEQLDMAYLQLVSEKRGVAALLEWALKSI